MTSEYHRQQLLSIANYEILLQCLIPGLQKNLSWNVLKQYSLHSLCGRGAMKSLSMAPLRYIMDQKSLK
ncbi:hypothetical protein CJF30_00003828 [Rutstroemia sp. NJR-2017a BBW]|nr:hypothetical protein CJF30_00003828 [Rutstroemia sp. NJR-2017a BBW]